MATIVNDSSHTRCQRSPGSLCEMISEGELATAIHAAYGYKISAIEPMLGGLDASAQLFLATDVDGIRFVIKLREGPPAGFALSIALAEHRIEEVLAPFANLQGDWRIVVGSASVAVYPYVDGANGFEKPLEAHHWRTVGAALRRIHDVALTSDLRSTLPIESFTVPGEEEFRVRSQKVLKSCDPNLRSLRETLQEHAGAIETVLSRCRELGSLCQEKSWNRVLCHADLHVGNILIGTDDQVWLIDWDAPRLAPAECDLVFFLGPGISGHDATVEPEFLSGYGDITPNCLALTYFRYARAMEDIVSFSREAMDDAATEGERLESLRHLNLLFAPRMIVETAKQSDARLDPL